MNARPARKNQSLTATALLSLLMLSLVLGGCASQPGPDPWEKTNRDIYDFNNGLDKYVLKPASDGYVYAIPKPVRTGVGHGFDNLEYANVWVNDFLQAKWCQGGSDVGRMAVNSTLGIGGIFDVATQWNMVSHENDFGVTLGKWGVKPGPYVVIPLLGPSSLRDVAKYPVEEVTDPLTWICIPLPVEIGLYSLETVDLRSRLEILAKFRNDAAIDPYVFTRDAYLAHRENRIYDGNATQPADLYDEGDSDSATQPATTPTATKPTTK